MAETGVPALEGQAFLTNAKGRRICGAKRAGGRGTCQSTILGPNGRCRIHGGWRKRGVANHAFKHGRYSTALPEKLRADYEAQRTDGDLLTLREEIALVDALIMERLRTLGSGQTGELWQQLQYRYNEARMAAALGEKARMQRHFAAMRELIEEGASPSSERRELLDLMERRRRMVETERRLLVEMGLMLSANDLLTTLAVVVSIIEEHVEDGKVRARIGNDIRRLVVARTSRPAFATDRLGGDPTRALSE